MIFPNCWRRRRPSTGCASIACRRKDRYLLALGNTRFQQGDFVRTLLSDPRRTSRDPFVLYLLFFALLALAACGGEIEPGDRPGEHAGRSAA